MRNKERSGIVGELREYFKTGDRLRIGGKASYDLKLTDKDSNVRNSVSRSDSTHKKDYICVLVGLGNGTISSSSEKGGARENHLSRWVLVW